jgi:hypothetical protein
MLRVCYAEHSRSISLYRIDEIAVVQKGYLWLAVLTSKTVYLISDPLIYKICKYLMLNVLFNRLVGLMVILPAKRNF